MCVNIYGVFQEIRPSNIAPENLRFKNEVTLKAGEAFSQIMKKTDENSIAYSLRLTEVISNSLAHIHWTKYEPKKFNQTVPIWENYFLYFMSVFTSIPEYKRYHFSNYHKSIERGIGICGDASIIYSQVLTKHNIDNRIITFPGHVVTSVISEGKSFIADPDFGVVIPFSPSEIKKNPYLVSTYYEEKGFSQKEINNLINKYGKTFEEWDGVSHFITKKYYFEKIAYILKWPLPIIMIFFAFWRLKNET